MTSPSRASILTAMDHESRISKARDVASKIKVHVNALAAENRLRIVYGEVTSLGTQQGFEKRVNALLKLGIAAAEVVHTQVDLKEAKLK